MAEISAEEFRKRLHSKSSTDGPQERCPHCGRADTRTKTETTGPNRSHEQNYFCGQCLGHFDQPVQADSIEDAIAIAEQSHSE